MVDFVRLHLRKRLEALLNQASNDELEATIAKLRRFLQRSDGAPTQSDDQHGQKENMMSLEDKIAALTTAIEANTAALKAGGAKPAAAGSTSTKPAADKPATGKHTKAEATAALDEVKEKFGTPAAVALRDEYAKVKKMAELTDPAAIDALYEACKKKMEEQQQPADEI